MPAAESGFLIQPKTTGIEISICELQSSGYAWYILKGYTLISQKALTLPTSFKLLLKYNNPI